MILTCPECSTRYFVADGVVGPEGKAVRCASCTARWTAFPEAETELELATPVEPASFAPKVQAAPEPKVEAKPEPAERPANAAPKKIREKVEARKTLREAAVTGMVWAGMGAMMVLLVGAAVVFRADVVRIAPRTASAFAAVGLSVNPTGLVFDGVSASPSLQDGHAALVVSGAIRNIEKRTVSAPAIRINVLDKSGHAIAHKVVDGPAGAIAPGQSHQFVVAVLDPPAAANDVEVKFAASPKTAKPAKGHGGPHGEGHEAPAKAHEAPAAQGEAHGAAAAPAHHGAEASLRGSMAAEISHMTASPRPILEAMEAKPLPSGSPYALHHPHG